MERRLGQRFEYLLLGVLVMIFLSIMAALSLLKVDPSVQTTFAGWGGATLAMIAQFVNFFTGSSKGSRLKDEQQGGDKSVEITNSTVSTNVGATENKGDPKP